MLCAKVAFSPLIGFITPRQLGPITSHLAADNVRDLTLQVFAVLAVLLEAGGDHDRCRDTKFTDSANQVRNGIGRGR